MRKKLKSKTKEKFGEVKKARRLQGRGLKAGLQFFCFLKELKIVEGRNTGVPLIVNAMNNNGSNLPFFITDEDRSYFLVILPIHKVFLNVEEKNISKPRTDRNKLRDLILETLRENGNLSMNQIANLLGYSKLTNTIRGVVKEMLDKNDVKYLYPDKPKSRKQKICLLNNRKFKS